MMEVMDHTCWEAGLGGIEALSLLNLSCTLGVNGFGDEMMLDDVVANAEFDAVRPIFETVCNDDGEEDSSDLLSVLLFSDDLFCPGIFIDNLWQLGMYNEKLFHELLPTMMKSYQKWWEHSKK